MSWMTVFISSHTGVKHSRTPISIWQNTIIKRCVQCVFVYFAQSSGILSQRSPSICQLFSICKTEKKIFVSVFVSCIQRTGSIRLIQKQIGMKIPSKSVQLRKLKSILPVYRGIRMKYFVNSMYEFDPLAIHTFHWFSWKIMRLFLFSLNKMRYPFPLRFYFCVSLISV